MQTLPTNVFFDLSDIKISRLAFIHWRERIGFRPAVLILIEHWPKDCRLHIFSCSRKYRPIGFRQRITIKIKMNHPVLLLGLLGKHRKQTGIRPNLMQNTPALLSFSSLPTPRSKQIQRAAHKPETKGMIIEQNYLR